MVEKLKYAASNEQRKRMLFQVKITYIRISNSFPHLKRHEDKCLLQLLKMSNRENYDVTYVVKMAQPNTVLIPLSRRRFRVFLIQAKTTLTGLY